MTKFLFGQIVVEFFLQVLIVYHGLTFNWLLIFGLLYAFSSFNLLFLVLAHPFWLIYSLEKLINQKLWLTCFK